ncbi:unnamed protein product [Orchesella dallaii]|uniref:Neurotransmitter-gated ion-channel ligand-binding domain-containing protein n=1 Tax=Orchesella dallaii TaxID=48710 RepID=A0ABP1Q8R3_9HEXA
MNKIFIVSAMLLALANAAPDFLSGIASPIANAVDAIADVTSTQAPVEDLTTTQAPVEDLTTTPAPDAPTTKDPKFITSDNSTTEERTKLVAKLFKDYDKKVNPDDLKIKFGVALIDFHILEDKDAVENYCWLRYVWTDPRLQWNAEEYGGAAVLRMDSDMVWKPDVTLYNSADPVHMINCWESNVLIYPNGEILWVPPCKMLSRCHLTLKREPYGEQVCGLKFGSWTYDGFTMDLEFYNGNKTIDLTDLSNSSGFEILSTTAEKTDKYYPCCKEPYPDLTFNMTIKRIPGEELIKKW